MEEIPYISTQNSNIPNIQVNGTGIPLIRTKIPFIRQPRVAQVNEVYVSDIRGWMMTPPNTNVLSPPVVIHAGTPIVDMPGCVAVHKENVKQRSRNKMLVNDDPKGNVVLCDAGMPYYEPPNYDARELTWQTITPDQEEQEEGLDIDEPELSTDTPEPPPTERPPEEVECPPPNARRIGDRNQKGDEQVKEYKLTPDGKICETIWEPVPMVEQFLPSPGVVTTTATIATVATASALFAKPLADLLLKVVKPVIKKVMTKVKTMLGQSPHRPNLAEQRTNRYREKKGMLPINFGKKKKPLKKG